MFSSVFNRIAELRYISAAEGIGRALKQKHGKHKKTDITRETHKAEEATSYVDSTWQQKGAQIGRASV